MSEVDKYGEVPMPKLGAAVIGPAAWRNNTMREIRNATTSMFNSDKYNESTRSTKPIPHLRDILCDLSNAEAQRHYRETRSVVNILREFYIDLNEDIKSLTRSREWVEKTLDHTRKDIKLNEETTGFRSARPAREKELSDQADHMIQGEKQQLHAIKKLLEAKLLSVRQHLQVSDKARQRLSNVLRERQRVLELINQTTSARSAMGRSLTDKYTNTNICAPNRGIQSADPDNFRKVLPPVDALGAYTPECEAAMVDAKEASERCRLLRREIRDAIERCSKVQTLTHRAVNDSLTGRIAETADLSQQLGLAAGQNNSAIARTQKWFDNTERAWMNTQGPEMARWIETREKLTRPMVRVFQRHPGNQLPESQEIVRSGSELLDSLRTTGQNLAMLRLAQIRLKDDIRDKTAGLSIDSGILRMRRGKANHRWITGPL